MSDKLPLKIRVDIRDKWDSPTSAVNKAVESLFKVLGHRIAPMMEWAALWAELKDRFPDNGTFVPTIDGFVVSWYERLIARLENDSYAKWTEELLELLSSATKRVELRVEPVKNYTRPTTKWNEKMSVFILGVPSAEPVSLGKVLVGLDQDLGNIFTSNAEGVTLKDDGWADVMDDDLQSFAPVSRDKFAVERLPSLDALARPDELFPLTTPYILILNVQGNQSITVQCSHQPSLELLDSYLQKWNKKGGNDYRKPTALKVELNDSDMFFGVVDTLTIVPYNAHGNGVAMNPTMIIAFIEGILGYRLVHTTGAQWVYRSDQRLR